jgi:hypothetical protein
VGVRRLGEKPLLLIDAPQSGEGLWLESNTFTIIHP